MQVGEALNRVSEGLFVDLGILLPDAVADCTIVDGGKVENSWQSPMGSD